jgi:HlyD family secretion protein
MQRYRWIKLFIILAVVILAIGYGFRPRPVLVDGVKVIRAAMRETVLEEGKTRVIDRFVISAPIAGYIRRIKMDVGDAVSQGNPLVYLEPLRSNVLDPRSRAEAQARVAAAEAALKRAQSSAKAAQADAHFAATELVRIKGLYTEGFASQEQLDQADAEARRTKANHNSADFAAKVARFDLEAASTALKYSAAENTQDLSELVILRAPVDGSILKIHRESESVVGPGEALMEIGNPSALEVEVDVLSADAVRIKPGMPVIIERWGGEASLMGRVKVVEPVGFTKISALGVEEQRVYVILSIVSPEIEWERLGDGYRVEAGFILWEGDDVLQIPTSALYRYAEGWAVFIVENRKARRRQVELGHRSGFTAEILSGLSAGELVITHPNDAIEDGVRVRLRQQ